MTDESEMGLDFSDVQDDLEDESYPLEKEELVEKYGDREIGIESGSKTLREILKPVDEKTYGGFDQVKQSILTMVGDSAEGREDYSDRGTSADQSDQASF